jgi:hypothetical protein
MAVKKRIKKSVSGDGPETLAADAEIRQTKQVHYPHIFQCVKGRGDL